MGYTRYSVYLMGADLTAVFYDTFFANFHTIISWSLYGTICIFLPQFSALFQLFKGFERLPLVLSNPLFLQPNNFL